MKLTKPSVLAPLLTTPILLACSPAPQTETTKPTSAEFVAAAEADLAQEIERAGRAAWIYSNFITEDTAALASEAEQVFNDKAVKYASEAANVDASSLNDTDKRKLEILGRTITLPAPQNAEKSSELAQINSELNGMYGKGRYCFSDGRCLSQPEISSLMSTSTNADELLEVWQGWREISKPMRPLFTRQVELANEGAKELGYANVSELWQSKYDMPAPEFPKELDRLWGEVKPLYDALHCYVRGELGEQYGTDVIPQDGMIPAHLLGNLWSQQWGNVYDLVAPEGSAPSYDLTKILAEHNYDEIKMVEQAESFFTSLGFEPLPQTFWDRSLFIEPKDRDVVCHASAWDLDNEDDIRIKMCIQKNAEDFVVIHHELGHNIYQRAYKHQPFLFKDSANDGFHEAIGDTIALSITPEYLQQIGLLEDLPSKESDIGLLLRQALDKVAFLPFGLMIDQWRWKVYSGEITPENYNQAWWEMRAKYQGITSPVARSEEDFDPGAKYHVPASVPYTRYFLAHILQFQFHQALCETAGFEGDIHRCTIYGNEKAGQQLASMLEAGASKPWPEALAMVTGTKQMSGQPLLDYFAPLQTWLDEQNSSANRQCGW
ncbi:M2 family metallopeptidase [Ferrimonas aestuarii]|uniref:M2 family metallopeptidase n=1 Tax=Ferrimonas aestuarii TaxID=2569539 RepID=A0A4U1BK42_9GAMM|nr:M2 family metallopeptidase [Ferrimonas aestuarii]TKB51980.1 M2 family metallopeptidase [Ferrimonas aestuarii]